MRKLRKRLLPAALQKAIERFPEIVSKNKTDKIKKQQFADKVFGSLAKKVHKTVHGKKPRRHPSGS